MFSFWWGIDSWLNIDDFIAFSISADLDSSSYNIYETISNRL